MTAFAGTWTLIRFILRRDRVRVPIWIVGIVITVAGTALVLPDTFPTQQDRQTRAELVANPAFKMLLGPGIGLEDYTFGAMMSNEMLGITSIAIALMSIFMVVRHTRTEEESGRAELVRSSVVGRHAAMTAVLVVATIVNVLIAGLVAIALTASLDELQPGGSIVFGAALAAVGIAFAAVAAVTVQINEFSKGATGMAAATLGVTYAIRGFGDVQENFLSWLSPLGWALKTEPYVGNRWWPLALLIGLTAMLVPVAYALSVRRDIAAGISPPRPGPATASTLLGRPFGMVVRLHRGSLLGWAVGITLFASAVGLIVPDAADMVAENPVAQEYLQALGLDETAVIDSALSLYISIFALIASIYTVGTIARLRIEETSLRAENVLATAVSRIRWVGEPLAFAIVTSTGILVMAGLGTGIVFSIDTGDVGDIWRVVGAAVSYAPALWLAAAIAVAVFGLVPRLMVMAWTVPVYGLIVLLLGPLLGLPHWLHNASPFEQVPRLPAVDFNVIPLLVMSVIAVLLIVAGLFGIRRRDMDFV